MSIVGLSLARIINQIQDIKIACDRLKTNNNKNAEN